MSKDPVLVIQMQRMGDLVLSFPLLGCLPMLYPEHPIWVVGEKKFFQPLMPLSPNAVYFQYTDPKDLSKSFQDRNFHSIINLSHRRDAAEVAGQLKAKHYFGPRFHEGLYEVNGKWQLYLASLTHNNRFNQYHWSDLNSLGIIPTNLIKKTMWPIPKPIREKKEGNRVGLFLGASERAKRPEAPFWAALSRQLLHDGLKPVFLGGEAEKKLGSEVADILKSPALNLCGHFKIKELVSFIDNLDLLISPDTGPMHISVWTRTPVLNLSMGPVNPWETGPTAPGHYVLRADMSCLGCWRCEHDEVLCKGKFIPRHVGHIVKALVQNYGKPEIPGTVKDLLLYRSARDEYGLYQLEEVYGFDDKGLGTSYIWSGLSRFWRAYFGEVFNVFEDGRAEAAWKDLKEKQPDLAENFLQSMKAFLLFMSNATKGKLDDFLNDQELWRKTPSLSRPLSGYCQMYIQNFQGSRESVLEIIHMVERLLAVLKL